MSKGSTFSVKHLDRWQHYHHKASAPTWSPPWCKLHKQFWTDYTMLQLPPLTRLLYLGCISLATEMHNCVPADPAYLSQRLGFPVKQTMITELHQAGRIDLSTPPVDEGPATVNGHAVSPPYPQQARDIIAYLNQISGKHFREAQANLDLITARLKDGATVQDCMDVIDKKVRQWQGDPKMQQYLRPETLFNRTKFESYVAEVEPETLNPAEFLKGQG